MAEKIEITIKGLTEDNVEALTNLLEDFFDLQK